MATTKAAASKGRIVHRPISCRMGWRPDLPDARDLYAIEAVHTLPPRVDLRAQCPEVYDQGQYGSCTANAIGGAFEFVTMKQGGKAVPGSRMFIYYGERDIEGDVGQDNGAQIRDGMKVVNKLGVPAESLWKYTAGNFAKRPTKSVYAAAAKHKATSYARVINRAPNHALQVLASGLPIVFGFTVYESFESDAVASTGIVPMPSTAEAVLGGHAVLAVGYDVEAQRLIVRNSWGTGWGDKGYFYMPFAYAFNTNLSDDWWVLRADT